MSIRNKIPIFWLICLFFLAGCRGEPPEKPAHPLDRPLFERISAADFPDFKDDQSIESLRSAILKSLAWYEKVPEDRPLAFGNRNIAAKAMRDSMLHFLSLLDTGCLDAQSIAREFEIFRVVPPDPYGRILVTGYYEPLLDGSLKASGKFKWPIYGVPSDLLVIDLERFDPARFRGERLVGRLEKNRFVPYYSRSEIDGKKKIEHSGAQLAWLKDPVDCFFLHVQGSGIIRLPDGRQLRVGYAGANGRPYRSIGKRLLDIGAVSREEMSLQAIRGWLNSHPESRDEVMWENESYVFFRWVENGPLGSLNAVLTAGRSVAGDPKFQPRGALAFLVSEKPRFDSSGQIEGWDKFGRWVLNQDTGGAIKGPGRIDLFCGAGADGEKTAGPMKQPGELYYVIKKDLAPDAVK